MIVAIEGGVGVGKTTLLNGLIQTYSNSLKVPEYFDIIPKEEHDSVLSLSEDEKLKLFLRLEESRKSFLDTSGETLYFVDRSFLTLFSYQYAIGRFSLLDNEIFTSAQMRNNFILPDLIINLDVDNNIRRKRVNQRGFEVFPLLLESDFNRKNTNFIRAYSEACSFLDLDTSYLTPEEVLDEAQLVIQATQQSNDSTLGNNFSKISMSLLNQLNIAEQKLSNNPSPKI